MTATVTITQNLGGKGYEVIVTRPTAPPSFFNFWASSSKTTVHHLQSYEDVLALVNTFPSAKVVETLDFTGQFRTGGRYDDSSKK
tara:strand:- start:16127 stop:16381 length:255 start_codon:yes stop_codon:yes gene_type:complete